MFSIQTTERWSVSVRNTSAWIIKVSVFLQRLMVRSFSSYIAKNPRGETDGTIRLYSKSNMKNFYLIRHVHVETLSCEMQGIKKQFSRLLALPRLHVVHVFEWNNRRDFNGICKQCDMTFIASLKSAIHLRRSLSTLRHNKRLHNAQFINHTARTMAQHKYFLTPRFWGFSLFTQNNMFNMFSVYVFRPRSLPLWLSPSKLSLYSLPSTRCLRFVCVQVFLRFVWLSVFCFAVQDSSCGSGSFNDLRK